VLSVIQRIGIQIVIDIGIDGSSLAACARSTGGQKRSVGFRFAPPSTLPFVDSDPNKLSTVAAIFLIHFQQVSIKTLEMNTGISMLAVTAIDYGDDNGLIKGLVK
jgi:hypothetical protein